MDYSRVINEIFSQFTGPKFAVKLWDGSVRYYGTGDSTLFTLIINDSMAVQRLLAQGSVSLTWKGKFKSKGI